MNVFGVRATDLQKELGRSALSVDRWHFRQTFCKDVHTVAYDITRFV